MPLKRLESSVYVNLVSLHVKTTLFICLFVVVVVVVVVRPGRKHFAYMKMSTLTVKGRKFISSPSLVYVMQVVVRTYSNGDLHRTQTFNVLLGKV